MVGRKERRLGLLAAMQEALYREERAPMEAGVVDAVLLEHV